MSREDQVQAALKALADHDRHRESRLPAPRMHALHRVSRWKTGPAYAVAALAAAAAVTVMVRPEHAVLAPAPAVVQPAPVTEAIAPPVESAPKPSPRVVRQAKPVLASAPVEIPDNGEIATEFFPLTEAPMPFQHGQLVRVVVPAVTMQRVGLPVRPERWSDGVTADLLVGDEGMPRAIRFVSFEQ